MHLVNAQGIVRLPRKRTEGSLASRKEELLTLNMISFKETQ